MELKKCHGTDGDWVKKSHYEELQKELEKVKSDMFECVDCNNTQDGIKKTDLCDVCYWQKRAYNNQHIISNLKNKIKSLKKYCMHSYNCPKSFSKEISWDCRCGLDGLLNYE